MEATELRSRPDAVLPRLCSLLGLEFDEELLHWAPADGVRLGQLRSRQAHWYRRVLASTGFDPSSEPVPSLEELGSLRPVVAGCVAAYRVLAEAAADGEEGA